MDYTNLIQKAMSAMTYAYSPYSKFRVGAALLTKSGKVYTGCNIENVSFGGTICAERVALFKAISEGDREFEAIVVVNSSSALVTPCGFCRQVLAEFCPNLLVILANEKEENRYRIAELLPHAFDSFQSN